MHGIIMVTNSKRKSSYRAWGRNENFEIKCFAVNFQKNYERLQGNQLKSGSRLFHSYIKRRKVSTTFNRFIKVKMIIVYDESNV